MGTRWGAVVFFAAFTWVGGVKVTLAAADLEPFPFPWNDASPGVTNLSAWQRPVEAGDEEARVRVEGAQYRLRGERVRFLGVNVTASMAFPSRERAEAHAARLARFGFNGVRFHHLEAPWQKNEVLVDYGRGNSRELAADRLDRLHYFVAQLARHGIYTNMNLLVSREFQPGDGLGPEIALMNWKDQHVLGFFDDRALELHKEYARKLLTAPNPYRDGRSLAADPAVAFVEIMNENGLAQKWHEGVLDRMPGVYRARLAARWNEWLKTRYGNTGAMLAAWKAVDQPLEPNRLDNSDFSAGTARWVLERHTTAVAAAAAAREFDGQPSLRIEVTTPGSANWHVQLNQSGLRVERDGVYTMSFWAKAAASTPVSCTLQRAHTDYASLAPAINITAGAEWREYSIVFQSGVSESNARINFNGFGDRRATVWLAGVRFQPGGRLGGLAAGESLEESTVPLLARAAGGATLDHRRDWTRFLFALERRYWDDLYGYLKRDLGYAGIVFATIVANSPPNTQAGMDAIDSHSYWSHPTFPPGLDFNPEEWNVNNASMVNDRNGGGLGGIARQRVAGKPHNVTEYQHCAPNSFVSEGPLLAAAYAALQDWDSLWFFEYPTGAAEFTTGFFDHSGHPGRLANNLIAAALFRRGDVSPAANEFVTAFDPETELNASVARGGAWNIGDGSHAGVPAALALVSRLALAVGEGATGLVEPPAAPAGAMLRADTGQLQWDVSRAGRGLVTVDTPRTKAAVGYLAAGGSIRFDGGIEFGGETRLGWATLGLTAVEGGSLAPAAGQNLAAVLVATGDYANTGMVWKDAGKTSVGSRWGSAPSLIEAVRASVVLPVRAARLKVWALDERGARARELAVASVRDGAAAAFEIGSDGPATLWYEIRVDGGE